MGGVIIASFTGDTFPIDTNTQDLAVIVTAETPGNDFTFDWWRVGSGGDPDTLVSSSGLTSGTTHTYTRPATSGAANDYRVEIVEYNSGVQTNTGQTTAAVHYRPKVNTDIGPAGAIRECGIKVFTLTVDGDLSHFYRLTEDSDDPTWNLYIASGSSGVTQHTLASIVSTTDNSKNGSEYIFEISYDSETALATNSSSTFTLAVGNLLPLPTQQPQTITIDAGLDATFTYTFRSCDPFTYEWIKSPATVIGSGAGGANQAGVQEHMVSITIPDVIKLTHEGTYFCDVTNTHANNSSDTATLNINDPPLNDLNQRRRFYTANQAR